MIIDVNKILSTPTPITVRDSHDEAIDLASFAKLVAGSDYQTRLWAYFRRRWLLFPLEREDAKLRWWWRGRGGDLERTLNQRDEIPPDYVKQNWQHTWLEKEDEVFITKVPLQLLGILSIPIPSNHRAYTRITVTNVGAWTSAMVLSMARSVRTVVSPPRSIICLDERKLG